MRIAIASTGLDVSPCFERCTSLTIYTITCGIISGCQNTPRPQVTDEHLAALLSELSIDCVVAGCIGQATEKALTEAGIEVVTGITGSARNAAEFALARTLACDEWLDDEDDILVSI